MFIKNKVECNEFVRGNFGRSLHFLLASGSLAEPLSATGRTIRFRGILLKNTDIVATSGSKWTV